MSWNPNWSYGFVPTTAQWNNAFGNKQDNLDYTPLNQAGGTMVGKLSIAASTAQSSGFRLYQGVAPANPNNGDMWLASTGLFIQVNNVSVGPLVAGNSITNINPVSPGTIDNMVIGGTTARAGTFTSLSASGGITPVSNNGGSLGSTTLQWSGLFLASGAAINFANGNVTVTHSNNLLTISKAFTVTGALTASGATTLSPANANVALSPTGSGVVTINPATAGAMDNMSVGATVAGSGAFTTLTASSAITLSPANYNVIVSPTGSGLVSVYPATVGTIDNMVIGASTPKALTATTLALSTGTIASASTTNLSIVAASEVTITGTTTIASFGTLPAGALRFLTFSAALTLTYNATSMILPGRANITTAAGDSAVVQSLGSGNWKVISYQVAVALPTVSFMTPWVAYTPTFNGIGTATGIQCRSRRVGANLEVEVAFMTGTVTATTFDMTMGFNGLSGGVVCDTYWNTFRPVVGVGVSQVAGTQSIYVLALGGSNVVNLSYASAGRDSVTPVPGTVIGSAVPVELRFSVPIDGWNA
ncbi:hypothetical protein [Rhizobiales bacterium 3FA27D7]|jgi:hypothetical protein|uniref:hypothetical protein n=1 Tax=Mesorhizobium sp. 2RAF21 TaxID=3232995 RepID=UPI0010F9243A